MAATETAVSLETYLRTEYRPDVEYIHGQLKEKPAPEFLHGVVQVILGSWFRDHRKEWNILVAVETRTQVDVDHVRLPDVVVVRKGEGAHGALVKAPLIAIEILSPSDSYADLRERATDLRAMGVQNIWLLDPHRRNAEVWTGKHWQSFDSQRLEAVDAPVYLDLDWLWAAVNEEQI
jgi:Uma2 family endonuclease